MFFFFFFQAEDGIRDVAVTGVQTCALPISLRPVTTTRQPNSDASPRARAKPIPREPPEMRIVSASSRSEERRVGKECRSRWARSNEKKKKQESICQRNDNKNRGTQKREEHI